MARQFKVAKYMVWESAKAVLIYYVVIAFIVAFWAVLPVTVSINDIRFNGIESSTSIFLLVAGLVSFKPNYLFLQANGVTRRQYWAGGLLGMAAVTLAMTAIDAALGLISGLFMNARHGLPPLIYPGSSPAAAFLWTLALNLSAVTAGWFITMLYYRCGKWLKLAISFSPVVFLAAMLAVDGMTGNGFSGAIAGAVSAAMGLGDAPGILPGICTLAAAAAALAGLCFLLVRRAPVKEQVG
jgi:hypothetical protein